MVFVHSEPWAGRVILSSDTVLGRREAVHYDD